MRHKQPESRGAQKLVCNAPRYNHVNWSMERRAGLRGAEALEVAPLVGASGAPVVEGAADDVGFGAGL